MKKQVVFACDIGGSKLLCGFVSENGDTIDTEKALLSPDITTEMIENHLRNMYTILSQRNPEHQPIACGMTIPGLADAENGI